MDWEGGSDHWESGSELGQRYSEEHVIVAVQNRDGTTSYDIVKTTRPYCV